MVMLVPQHPGPSDEQTVYQPTVAGAESNVACYLSKLGLRTRWVSRVGADPFGQLVLDEVTSRGVDVSMTVVDPYRPTGVAFKDRTTPATKVRYFRSGSAASALGREDAERILAADAPMLHLTGITSALSDSCETFVRTLVDERPASTTLTYDVNWRPALWTGTDEGEILRTARRCNVVFVGLDEAAALWDVQDPEAVRNLLPEPALLVVKQGAAGATVYDANVGTFVSALKVDVVESVGAGDAFAGGFIAGLHKGFAPARAARLGVIAASSALRTIGDVGDLPSAEKIDELLDLDEAVWRQHVYQPLGERDGIVADR